MKINHESPINSYLSPDITLLNKIIDLLDLNSLPINRDTIDGYWQKAQFAAKLAAAYPHLNIDVVVLCTFLLPLIKQGYLNINNSASLMEMLADLEVEHKWQVFETLIHAQSSFATGEAKIAQYFYH
ncbi:hypothetical protein [Desulfotomaculum nigrificans]|uniref:hypothetical protein n=1 Tax=Desulfotomaculum nigrificans TaxID=1565 RepID=UPI0001FAEA6D|nr:hypothetical protein [Desulfotomaculum nigrificans]